MLTQSELFTRLSAANQNHLVEYLSKVSPDSARESIIDQLSSIDFEELQSLIQRYILNPESDTLDSEILPAKYFALNGDWDREEFRLKGEDLIRAGKIACFTVAGGQGSRLGFEGPKGCFPTSCVRDHSLFQIFAEGILSSSKKYETTIPWYIMTSPLNHEATCGFFEENDYFGLDRDHVMFFEQGIMPSLDAQSGQILMADPMHIATNPDGHGGAFKALQVSGALSDMQSRGIEHMSYFQVDNPLSCLVDPVFIGLHANSSESSSEFSSKMVAKASWDEKVGVFCEVDRATQVIEYSDLPEELAKQTNEQGRLAFNAGSIAIHMISVSFIDQIVHNPEYSLPYHRASKKVSHFNLSTGQSETPNENNAVKLEKFVFDGIPMASRSIVMETDRLEEFGPVKNATGTDSIVSSKQLQTQRAASWLESVGVSVPKSDDGSIDATIEISPMSALCAQDLSKLELPDSIEPGSSIVI